MGFSATLQRADGTQTGAITVETDAYQPVLTLRTTNCPVSTETPWASCLSHKKIEKSPLIKAITWERQTCFHKGFIEFDFGWGRLVPVPDQGWAYGGGTGSDIMREQRI